MERRTHGFCGRGDVPRGTSLDGGSGRAERARSTWNVRFQSGSTSPAAGRFGYDPAGIARDPRGEFAWKRPNRASAAGSNALLGDTGDRRDAAAQPTATAIGEDPAQPVPAPQAVRRRRTEAAHRQRARPTACCSRSSCGQVGDGYQLIAGERRLRAAQAAGLDEVPVHVVDFDDQQVFEAALVENIQRSDLNPIEKAQGFKEYLDRFGLTQDQLGAQARPRPHDDQQPARAAEPARRGAGRGAARADHARATRRCSRASPTPNGRSRSARKRS